MSDRDDWLTKYLRLTDNTESPELFRLGCGMSAIAAVLKRKCHTQHAGFTIYPNMYLLLVGSPGMRKSYTMDLIVDMLNSIGVEMGAAKTTLEALIDTLAKSQEFFTLPDGNLELHSSLNLFSDEIAVLLKQRHSNLFAELCSWYGCNNTWTYTTKGSGKTTLTNIWVNLLACTTPETLIDEMQAEGGRGLSSRFIFIYGDKYDLIADPVIDHDLKEELCAELSEIMSLTGEFVITPAYKKLYTDWYLANGLTKKFNDIPQLLGYPSRRALHIKKISMISSASRGDDMLLKDVDFTRALGILERIEVDMIRLFDVRGTGRHKDVLKRVFHMIKSAGDAGVTKSEILRHHREDITSWHLENIMRTLIDAKLVSAKISNNDTLYTNLVQKE